MKENITAKRIAELRKESGISQEQFAEAIDESPSTCHLWETGKRVVSKVCQLVKIAKFFHCTTDYLTGLSDAKTFDLHQIDTVTVTNTTGLSENSVKVLHYLHTVPDVNGINGQTAAFINAHLENVYKDFHQIIESERAISIPVITLFTKMNQYIKGTGNSNPVKLSTDIPTVLSENDVCRMLYLDSILDSLKGLAREADGKKKPYTKSDFLDAARTIARACESNPEAFLDINVKDIVNDAFASARQFAPVLRSLREKKAVSIKEAAAGIGCSFKTLKEYESGERIPRDEIKIKIAEYYEVPACDIFYQKENEE